MPNINQNISFKNSQNQHLNVFQKQGCAFIRVCAFIRYNAVVPYFSHHPATYMYGFSLIWVCEVDIISRYINCIDHVQC